MKVVKIGFGFFLSIVLCISLMVPSIAQNIVFQQATQQTYLQDEDEVYFEEEAQVLKSIELFMGSPSGLELERLTTRLEAAVILVRMLGVEDLVRINKSQYHHPFGDIPDWANGYIGYLFEHNLIQGISTHVYGSDETIMTEAFMTLCLRSLGYNDLEKDFIWSKASDKAIEIELIDLDFYEYIKKNKYIKRDTVCGILYNLLNQQPKQTEQNSQTTLLTTLIEQGKLTKQEALENNIYIRPMNIEVVGEIVEINTTSTAVTFGQRNGVDYIVFIPLDMNEEETYITSFTVLTKEGQYYEIYIEEQLSIEEDFYHRLNVMDTISLQGSLAILAEFTPSAESVILLKLKHLQ